MRLSVVVTTTEPLCLLWCLWLILFLFLFSIIERSYSFKTQGGGNTVSSPISDAIDDDDVMDDLTPLF
jgi:hypothetical protein